MKVTAIVIAVILYTNAAILWVIANWSAMGRDSALFLWGVLLIPGIVAAGFWANYLHDQRKK